MSPSFYQRVYLAKKDFINAVKGNRSLCIGALFVTIAGVAFGVYVGIGIEGKESPFSVFASMIHLNYTPFSYLFPDLLRYLLSAALTLCSFFLPLPLLYPFIALFFFGKYFGQIACLAFLSDSFLAAFLSLMLIYLPLLLIGAEGLVYITLHASEYRLCRGGGCSRNHVKKVLLCFIKPVLVYLLILLVNYLLLCGIIYLLVIAI